MENCGPRLPSASCFGFGFGPLLANPDEKFAPDMRVPFELLQDRGACLVGTAEQVAEKIIKIRNEVGFEDFSFTAWLEMGGFSGEENEEQMHLFAEGVLPILRRELGASPLSAQPANGIGQPGSSRSSRFAPATLLGSSPRSAVAINRKSCWRAGWVGTPSCSCSRNRRWVWTSAPRPIFTRC